METGTVSFLPLDNLQPNPLQPRGVITPESISELVDSIKTHGIIQPLVVAHTPAGFQIIAGERRWRASKIAGLTEVPVRIIETSPQGMLEMAIVENVQRSDLNPIDRANSFERLIQEFSLNHSDICTRIGKSPAFVSNTLRLLDLPDALKDGLITGVIAEGHARALAGIPDRQQMIEAYKIILKEGGSVRRAEELARRFKKNLNKTSPKDGFDTRTVNELIDSMASDIQTSIGENARVKMRRSRAETAIQIVLKGNPQQTEEQIQDIYRAIVKRQVDDTPSENVVEARSESFTYSDEPVETNTQPEPEIDINPFSNPFEPLTPSPNSTENKEDNYPDY